MTITQAQLNHISSLAYLTIEPEIAQKFHNDLNDMIDFISQLTQVDTHHVLPLSNPMDATQLLRSDDVFNPSLIDELSTIAPLFKDGFYLVPIVIASEK